LYYTFRLFSSQLLALESGCAGRFGTRTARKSAKHTKAFRVFRALSLALSLSKGVFRGPNRPLALAEQRCDQLRQFHRGQFGGWAFWGGWSFDSGRWP
jgi:hypothetical protein